MARGEPGLRRGVGRSGEYAFKGQSDSIRSDLIEIDSAKTYELKGFFKTESNLLNVVTLGVAMHDAQKRQMRHWNVSSINGTMTELTAACESGNKTLKVKDASQWKPSPGFCAAFGQKENEPNFDVTPLGIAEIKPEGDHWRVVLNEPCGLNFPAGTPVIENSAGYNGIFLSGTITNDWTEIKGTINPEKWWPGTKYVSVVIQFKRDGKAGLALIDDLELKAQPLSE